MSVVKRVFDLIRRKQASADEELVKRTTCRLQFERELLGLMRSNRNK